jgi:hypothetical protein
MSGKQLTSLSYDDWIDHVFSHPVPKYQAAWYFDPDADWWNGPSDLTVGYLTRLFEDPETPLADFADSQISQGLHYLIDSGAGGVALALGDAAVPLADRERCVRAIHDLFAKLFVPRCTPHLSHRDEPGAGPLNGVCYMWWDVFAGGGPELNPATFATIERILALDSIACQESALHGLGHWPAGRDAAVAAIDAYLRRSPGLRPELAAYATAARSGCVL